MSRTALVVGGAECVWEDLDKVSGLFKPDLIIAVNDIGLWLTHIDHWVSYHHSQLFRWAQQRLDSGLPPPSSYWTNPANFKTSPYPDGFFKTIKTEGGSSGWMATAVALQKEKCKVVLAGVPMVPAMRHFNDKQKGKPWVDGKNYLSHWKTHSVKYAQAIRSMSGFTKELFGEPTLEWLQTDCSTFLNQL